MVCANPDLLVIHGGRPALCAGCDREQYESLGGRVRWHGKPYPSVYNSCFGLLGVADRRRILAIGDSLRTDIAGAAGAGIDSLFVAAAASTAPSSPATATSTSSQPQSARPAPTRSASPAASCGSSCDEWPERASCAQGRDCDMPAQWRAE